MAPPRRADQLVMAAVPGAAGAGREVGDRPSVPGQEGTTMAADRGHTGRLRDAVDAGPGDGRGCEQGDVSRGRWT